MGKEELQEVMMAEIESAESQEDMVTVLRKWAKMGPIGRDNPKAKSYYKDSIRNEL